MNGDAMPNSGKQLSDDGACEIGMDWADVVQSLNVWASCRAAAGEPATLDMAAASFCLSHMGIRRAMQELKTPFFWLSAEGVFEHDGY